MRGGHSPGDGAAGDEEFRVVQRQGRYIGEGQLPDIPETETGPHRVVIRPPADTGPEFALVNSQCPGAAAGVIAADDVGRAKSQVQQLLRVIEIAERDVIGKVKAGKRANASRQGRNSFEDGRVPFRETPECFRDGAR